MISQPSPRAEEKRGPCLLERPEAQWDGMLKNFYLYGLGPAFCLTAVGGNGVEQRLRVPAARALDPHPVLGFKNRQLVHAPPSCLLTNSMIILRRRMGSSQREECEDAESRMMNLGLCCAIHVRDLSSGFRMRRLSIPCAPLYSYHAEAAARPCNVDRIVSDPCSPGTILPNIQGPTVRASGLSLGM